MRGRTSAVRATILADAPMVVVSGTSGTVAVGASLAAAVLVAESVAPVVSAYTETNKTATATRNKTVVRDILNSYLSCLLSRAVCGIGSFRLNRT